MFIRKIFIRIMKDKNHNKNNSPVLVCVFFTYEGSLRKWDEAGILDREISVYKNLIKHGLR